MTNAHHKTEETEHAAPAEAWDAVAPAYDRYVTAGEADLARTALGLVGLRPGHQFLDVAAGTGGLSLPAARLGATVLATDWSTTMVELFRARAAAEGVDAEARVMDCHALDLPDDAYDVTGSQRSDIVRVLDGMVHERVDGTGTALFTAPLNIGYGTV